MGIATTESTNDPYEPNDDIASATTMPSDTIYATIGYDGDADFFKKNFSLNQNIAISLKSIPTGCDYDLYLCAMDGTILAASEATGTTDELITGTINVAGDYLVVVLPYTGYNDSVQYKLYAGDALKTASGSYWSNTLPKLTLNYANTDSAIDTLDLTYESGIPNGAVVTSMYLNGNYTGNFTGKELYTYISQVGTWYKADLSDICGQAKGKNAKQIWKFKWRVGQITQPIVSWTPQILINYQYTYIPY